MFYARFKRESKTIKEAAFTTAKAVFNKTLVTFTFFKNF